MGYPGSVYSPATINNGETVDASHQNDQNTELNAIEDALINGTISHDLTPSTSSTRSLGSATKRWKEAYVDAIQSTGNSTLGNVTATNSTIGNLTVTNLQVTGGSSGIATSPTEYARVWTTVVTQFTNSTGGKNAFAFIGQQALGNSSMHSTASNSSRVVLQSSGWHMVSGQFAISTGGGQFSAQLLKNDTVVIGEASCGFGGANSFYSFSVNSLYYFSSSDDYIGLRLRVVGGSPSTIRTVVEDTNSCWLAVTKL